MTAPIHLSEPQSRFMMSQAKSVAAVAGFGSGKTEVALFRMFATMEQYPGCNMLYLAPTVPLIKDIWYPKVETYLDARGVKYKINRSENTIKLEGYGSIFCRSMENPHRIIGFEVLDAFLDELDVLKEEKALEVWRKAKARCRQKAPKPNQMFVTTTPEGFKATYRLFKKTPLPNSELIQMSTYTNAHNLPDDYIDELKANYPAQLIEAYINGVFVNLTAMPVWNEYIRELHRSYETVQPTDTNLIVGMDFNVGRGCASIFVERKKGKKKGLHAVDEIYNSYDTPASIQILQARYPDKNIIVYPDASGNSRKSVNATTSDIAALKHAGFKVKVNKKNPNVKDRIMATNAQFMNGCGDIKLWVNDEKCPMTADNLEQQVYDNNGMPEKGEDKGDDTTDAFSYPIAYLHPIKKRTTRRTELREILG